MNTMDIRAIGLFLSCFGCVLSLFINFFLIPKTKKLEKVADELHGLKEAMLKEVTKISEHNHVFREEMHRTYVSKENIDMIIENRASQVVKDYCKDRHEAMKLKERN